MTPEERILLQTAARVLVTGANGSLGAQLPGYSFPVHHLPVFIPTRQAATKANAARIPQTYPLEGKEAPGFHNGYGGFSPDGREYIIDWNASSLKRQGRLAASQHPLPGSM